MKKCSRCKNEKKDSEFYKDKRAKDGLNCACKECINKVNKDWANKNPEKILELSRKSHERHKEKEKIYAREYARKLRKDNYKKYREYKDKWEKENPEKVKDIRRKAVKKWHVKNKEKVKEDHIKWNTENKDKKKFYSRVASRKSRLKFPEKNAARKMVSGAITLGILTRPSFCSKCLIGCKPEGHHPDYSKPLEVIWLCRECHNKEHGK